MRKVAATHDVKKKRKKATSIETIVMEKEELKKESKKHDYEWLNSLIIAMPDEIVREKVSKLFSKSDDKDALVEKLMVDIL